MDPVEPTPDPFAPFRPGPSVTPPAGPPPADAQPGNPRPGEWVPAATEPVPAAEPPKKRSIGPRVAAVAGAVVIGAGTIIGVHIATSHDATAAANGRSGGPGAGPASGGPGGFGGRGGGTVGTLASVNGSTLTLTTRNGGSVTVDTSSSTSVTKTVTGAIGDIRTGDHVQVRGGSTGADGIAAVEITDSGSIDAFARPDGAPGLGQGPPNANGQGPPNANGQVQPDANGQAPAQGFRDRGNVAGPNGTGGRLAGMVADGTVSSIKGGALTIKETDGTTVSATTSGDTRVIRIESSSVKALKIGETLRVAGTAASNGTITATAIESGDSALGGFRPGGATGGGPAGTAGSTDGSTAGSTGGAAGNAGNGAAPPAPFGLTPNPGA